MKKLLLALLFSLPAFLYGQDDGYTMLESIILTPNGEDNQKLTEAMKAHNSKFHSAEPYTASVWSISTGPNAGKVVWMMGPVTYSDLDSRPAGEDHDSDWAKVTEHLDEMGTVEYWKRDDDLSVNVTEATSPMIYVRIWEVNNKYGFLVDGLLKQASAAVAAMESDVEWGVWDNEFRQGNHGRHLATVSSLKNWADLDKDWEFMQAFKKVHGEDAWIPFLRTGELAWKNSYDEIWTLMPDMMAGE
jgi:hypothetical protein